MGFLIEPDYLPLIQSGNKSAMTQGLASIQATAEKSAIAEAISYLKQKYDTTGAFTDTTVWGRSNTYNANDRVYLNASSWATATSYSVNDIVLYSGIVYQCSTANSDTDFTPANWTVLGAQYTIYYAIYPAPVFDLVNGVYKVGDVVYWRGKTYTCKIATITRDHTTELQYRLNQNIPYGNIFPDDITQGTTYWGTGTTYNIPANTELTDTDYWTQGDNRDSKIVRTIVAMAIYHMSPNISVNNLPKNYIEAYRGTDDQIQPRGEGVVYPQHSALGWLQACSKGEVTANLPLIQPLQGKRIRYGGPIKNINTY